MKTALKVLGALVGLVIVGAGGFFGWAKSEVGAKLARTPEAHSIDIPIPYPLSTAEIAALRAEKKAEAEAAAEATAAPEPQEATADAGVGEPPAEGEGGDEPEATAEAAEAGAEGAESQAEPAEAPPAPEPAKDPLEGVDLAAIAKQRALERGKHLVTARYACIECHGKDFSGGVMIDDPGIGKLLGPNLTAGQGGVTEGFTAADWDRIVRHGIKKDGHPGMMPSEDFQLMSDQELSDIVVYLTSQPAVDNTVPTVSLGPLGTILVALGKLPIAYDKIHDHAGEHPKMPPKTAETAEFGEHLAGICTGCHRADLVGGPMPFGPPDWPPARNLTPHAEGTGGWTYENFITAMREGKRPDGTVLKEPMSLIVPYAQNMTDTEMKALWAYISSLPPKPTGK